MNPAPHYDDFRANVFTLVRRIPVGYVLTYGRIALLVGYPQNSRLVGRFMAGCPRDVPAFRVVNHSGRTVPGWGEQRDLLKKEGVSFKENGCVDLKKHLWKDY